MIYSDLLLDLWGINPMGQGIKKPGFITSI